MVISEELRNDIKHATAELKYHNMHCYDIYPWSNEHLENYYNYYDLKDKKSYVSLVPEITLYMQLLVVQLK